MPRFPDHARVIFIGDSITANNTAVAHVVHHYLKQYPEAGIRFYNSGIAGGNAGSLNFYLEKDTLVCRPTHAVVATGINDSGLSLLDSPRCAERLEKLTGYFQNYQKNLRTLCESLLSRGITVTLCTPFPYDEYSESTTPARRGAYALMMGYADFCRTLAAELKLALCDYNAYFGTQMQSEPLFSADRVHPTAHGQWHIAKCFLASQGEDIGEEEAIPESMLPWHKAVSRRRSMITAECLIARGHGESAKEMMRYVREYIDQKLYPGDYHRNIAGIYLEDKPQEAEKLQEIFALTDALTL